MNWFGLKQCFNVHKFPQNIFLEDLCKATHGLEGANEIVAPREFNGDLRNSNIFHLLPIESFVYLTFIQFLHYITIYSGYTRLCQSIKNEICTPYKQKSPVGFDLPLCFNVKCYYIRV